MDARGRALAIWNRRPEPGLSEQTGPVLISPAGTIDLVRVRQLLDQRNDRDVYLAE